MKIKTVCSSFIMTGLLIINNSSAMDKVHWSYSGSDGPEHWGTLNPNFSTCSSGKNQSPIDLTAMIESDLAPITVDYRAGGNEILNNGHTIQVNYKPGSTIRISGQTFQLKQFHFHSPSENTIDGQSFPLEAHFVHADNDGNLAVIAVMFKEGNSNEELAKIWSSMPGSEDEKLVLPELADANRLLPPDKEYYRFNGSLTTPPCSEGVWWLVMKSNSAVSNKQIEKFTHTMHHPNNRPVQPVNARTVLK
ncbi:MAG: carbonic anhydrase family protein [Desulforhopalus sp.]